MIYVNKKACSHATFNEFGIVIFVYLAPWHRNDLALLRL